MKRASGFTLIEVVIALAIGVFVVLAVIGTVQSLSRSAKNIEASVEEEEGWLRFSEIFRRDMRGWVPGGERQERDRSAETGTERPFLVLQTTSDALADSASNEAVPVQRMTTVRYLVKRNGDAISVMREEDGRLGRFTVPVLQARVEPKVEFFDGRNWRAGQQGKEMPQAVRLSVGSWVLVSGFHCQRGGSVDNPARF